MGNTYAVVQFNFKSADATALATMLYEVESLFNKYRKTKVVDEVLYIAFTKTSQTG